MSAGQRWAGCIAGLAIGLTSAGAAAAQQPLPDPSPVVQAQAPAPDPAPGGAARQVARRTPAAVVRRTPAAASTPARTAGGVTAATTTAARITPATTTPAATHAATRGPARRRATPSHTTRQRPSRQVTLAPVLRLRLDAVRGAIAALAPVAAAARPRAGDDVLPTILTVAGAALLALAATGAVTLARATARARA